MPDNRILLQRRELARAVVNQEDLHQQRRTGKEGDIAAHNPHQHRRFQRQDDGKDQRRISATMMDATVNVRLVCSPFISSGK